MPSIQEIERFKQVLNRLGGEPEILAARSEEIEDVPPPEEGLSQDLSELLQFSTPDGEPLPEEAEEGPEPRFAPSAGEPGEADLDFESLFGAEVPGENLDDIGQLGGLEPPEPAERFPEPAQFPASAAEGPEEADESVSAAELEGLMMGADLDDSTLEGFAFEDFTSEGIVSEDVAPEGGVLDSGVLDSGAPEGDILEQQEADPEAGDEQDWSLPDLNLGEESPPEPGAEEAQPFGPGLSGAPSGSDVEEDGGFDFSGLEILDPGRAGAESSLAEDSLAEDSLAEDSLAEDGLAEDDAGAPEGFEDFEFPDLGPQDAAEGEGVEEGLPEEFDLPEDFQLLQEEPEEESASDEPVRDDFSSEDLASEEPDDEFSLPAEFRLEPEQTERAEDGALRAEAPADEESFAAEDLELPDFGEDVFGTSGAGPAPAAGQAGAFAEEEIEAYSESAGPGFGEMSFDLEEGGPEALDALATPEALDAGPGAGEEIVMDDGDDFGVGFGEGDFQLDEFVLPEVGEQFGLEEEPPRKTGGPPAGAMEGPGGEEAPEEEIAAPAEEIELSEEDFASIRRTMSGLPRNLKIVVEELIGVKELTGEGLRILVGLLVEDAAPAAVAAQVARITGKKIVLPAAFQKKSGRAFEAERGTFAYAFRQNILPLLRAFILSGLVLAVLGYVGYRYVYRPLHADALYRQGYSRLKAESYESANRTFDQATRVRPIKSWHFRYAEGFIEQRQFILAEQKYDQLLARYPGDRKGLLDFAGFESRRVGNYSRADGLLDQLLDKNFRDPDALLLKGDNFLQWSDQRKGGPQHAETLEKARLHYGLYMDYHGRRDIVLFRMLRYFVRADKLKEALDLRQALEARPRLKVDAETYAELGGYLLDRQRNEDAGDTLRRALEADPRHPDTHYHLARYFRRLQKPVEEKKALEETIGLLAKADPWARARREDMLIDAHNRLGRWYWNGREYLRAQEQYDIAVAMIRGGQESRRFGTRPAFGEVFHNLADIYYYVDRSWDEALGLYREAVRNGYWTAPMGYKMGYAEYAGGRFDQALLEFSKVAEEQPENPNVLFALGNTLFLRGHYFSAEGHYLHLLTLLEGRRGRIPSLRPELNPEHRALVENTMQAYNNLGVALGRLAEQPRDPRRESQALAYFTFSSEFFDVLGRDPQTMTRGDTRNLAFLNQRGMLYPQQEFELQIYNRIPIDLQEPRFRE